MDLMIMDLWNVKNLEPPPINSAKADVKEIDIKFLSNVLKDAVEFFNNQPYLCSEAAVLSRTIYRLKMKFRSAKDFQAMEKLNRALRAYLEVGMSKVLKTFLDSVPQVYKTNKTYLPTKHMMDFVLVRMQGLGKILIRILDICKIVCQLCQQRLGLGHFWNIALITYGMAARIFVIIKTVIKYTCELYSNLLPYSSKLKNSGKQWLHEGYVLPKNLSDWLEIDWVDLETTIIEIVDEKPEPDMFYFNLIEDSDDDIEFCDEYILVKDDQTKKTVKEETVELSDNDVDIGEVINLSDGETSQVSNKENWGNKNSTLSGFDIDNNIDIGEVINLGSKTQKVELAKSRKRKRGKSILFEASSEVINLSNITTLQLKKKLNVKTTSQDVIEIVDSPQPKIIEKKKRQSARSMTEVIEITDNSFNGEIINLSDIESPKPPTRRGKKRKRVKNSESEIVEPGFKVTSLNPNKKRKKNKVKDGKKLLLVNVPNVKNSKKKKKHGFATHSKVQIRGTNLTKSKNVAPKLTTVRKPSLLSNASSFKKKKSTLNNTQSLNSEKKKRRKKKKKQ